MHISISHHMASLLELLKSIIGKWMCIGALRNSRESFFLLGALGGGSPGTVCAY